MTINSFRVIIFFVVALFVSVVSALEGDQQQPITLESNSGFYDDKKGLSIYTGNVVVVQGSLRLEADKVIVYLQDKQITKMVATGHFVKFKQLPEEGQEEVHGKSLIAEYYPKTSLLILLKKAVVWQGVNSTASDHIEYDRISEVIKAGDSQSSSKRVHVILKPTNETNEK